MKASLDFFTSIPSILPKMVILGEMKELGEVCYDEHRKMMEFLKDQPYDKIYLVGELLNISRIIHTVYLKMWRSLSIH